jgi:hypothetical protein
MSNTRNNKCYFQYCNRSVVITLEHKFTIHETGETKVSNTYHLCDDHGKCLMNKHVKIYDDLRCNNLDSHVKHDVVSYEDSCQVCGKFYCQSCRDKFVVNKFDGLRKCRQCQAYSAIPVEDGELIPCSFKSRAGQCQNLITNKRYRCDKYGCKRGYCDEHKFILNPSHREDGRFSSCQMCLPFNSSIWDNC